MPNLLTRLLGGRSVTPEAKSGHMLMAIRDLGAPDWTRRSFPALAQEGVMRNPVVHRCVRLIAEGAARVPLVAREAGKRLEEHPLPALLRRPNPHQSGSELLEAVYAYLQTAGNAYLHAAVADGEVKGLFGLRPDRMQAVVGRDGYAEAYAYTAGGRTQTLRQDTRPVPGVLHMSLFHPLDDHYGLAPLEAAQTSLDLHNAASRWNKALLDNSARPSGALVYSAGSGSLTPQQFERLKTELETAFQGAANAGRPMVLEGGLDWKALSISPRDMDFIEAKHVAAREIALAFGVPPMLLGIPGDATYANMAEANKALWRQTIVPLVRRVADDLSFWLEPAFAGVTLEADFDGIEVLSEDQASRWARIGGAGFLSDEEKRELLGVGG
ncbi:MAG: phage portal protein [Devosia sp.]|jgi:HK97 family phage portal protein|uniref:phage portal protein n=1 Tax=Devosia sp. 66-22 TaxID=1895753 RepID=UPI000929AF96|nr:phage portal protein [Devosia sp. 66-22]MBN9345419.1 phage portal protein [Devosia sp.]OJX51459.1 MAG: phage portal protein [Devosia sp. 66-22]